MLIKDLPHKVLDYACPISGLEDQYEWKTGNRLPGYFLMDLSNIGFLYLRQKRAPAPRMVLWGDGMGKAQHQFLAEIVGYQWTMQEGKAFSTAWKSALKSLHEGTPVILGLLDMYHLPYYEKFYHRFHIPQHFVLLVGFDENTEEALVLDNSLPEIQRVPLSDLKPAWNVHNPGQGRPNTFYTLNFYQEIADLETIVHKGLKKRAGCFLSPPTGFMGIRGLEKAQKDCLSWFTDLTPGQLKNSLEFLATFTCSVVPNLPQALLPYPLGYEDAHHAVRDRFSADIKRFAETYQQTQWTQAAELLRQSGDRIGELTQTAVRILKGEHGLKDTLPDLFGQIRTLEEKAWRLLL